MDHAVPSVSGMTRADRASAKGVRPNWRLMLALGVNMAMWAAIVAGVRVLID
ncbi:MAG: hypothetical protein ACK4YQ_12725 [Phenylobacterium sp.]|uniref:hypothetical protein n=1 Tax=Phenylobacterium sp. TaxID=1871053 RepID=UPI00391A7BF5